ncbi:hypothetical protein HYPSUDRAFT_318649 [Hypholoma sublateritium FD-334 SS-4]|uniref:Peptidase A1 domain-containing protein n=1 Tax=Hypholoma sublateritium (strain FD-334 SS-4) TaxID=945553 RepID=A0A0D2PCT3_HYPSF|nr:hypothetical protein HYPSUDRAFT_318649 [Hypholoma sublateritium FD-334 SS-4]
MGSCAPYTPLSFFLSFVLLPRNLFDSCLCLSPRAFLGSPILMFSLSHHAFVLAFLFLNFNIPLACALPNLPQSTSIAVSLSRSTHAYTHRNGTYMHGSIVQQQHTNRGIKRLALMTGRRSPSDYDLLWLLYERMATLSAALRREYEFDEIATILAYHSSASGRRFRGLGTNLGSSSGLLRKEGRSETVPTSVLRTTGLSIESNDIGYIANMKIGTPPKTFRLLIDSGSADLWVGATGCRSDAGGSCGNHTFLGHNSSSSYVQSKADWAIGYVSGSVWGYIVHDDVSIAGLPLKNLTFGVAFNESAEFTGNNIRFDGLLGLAKSEISQQHVPTFVQALSQAKLISSAIVSYKLPRLADGRNDTSELTLGAMDPNHYYPKSLVTVKNVNKFGFWGAAVDAVKVGNQNMGWSNRTIVMDTGTTLILAPKSDAQAIHNAIPGAQYDGNGFMVPCNMTTVLSLTIGGNAFTVEPRDIAFHPVEEGSATCVSGISVGTVGPFDLNTDWLVGDVFLKNVYFSTDEDNDEISIAKPLH